MGRKGNKEEIGEEIQGRGGSEENDETSDNRRNKCREVLKRLISPQT